MDSFIVTIIIFVFVIGVLVFVHELGHFLAARSVGIKVEEFAIGMGPKLWGFKRGETEYTIRAFPIGGYVSMFGEGDYDLKAPESFGSKSPLKRLLVLVAGVTMNFLLAMVLLFMLGLNQDFKYRNIEIQGFFTEEYKPWFGQKTEAYPIIRNVDEKSVLKGKVNDFDIITAVNGQENKVTNFSEVLIQNAGKEVTLTIIPYESNNSRDIKIKVPEINKELINNDSKPLVVVREFTSNSPFKDKVKQGDVIKRINNQTYSYENFINTINENKGKQTEFLMISSESGSEYSFRIDIENKERPLGITISPSLNYESILDVNTGSISFIKYEGVEKFYAGFAQSLNTVQNFFFSMEQLINMSFQKGSAVPIADNLGGAISIFDILGKIFVLFGFWGLIEIMALLSINLAVLNILPIPALDGGHTIFTLLEMITRRRLPARVYNYITMLGFVFLIGLMITVTGLDIAKRQPLNGWLCNDVIKTPFVCDLTKIE